MILLEIVVGAVIGGALAWFLVCALPLLIGWAVEIIERRVTR